MQKNQMSQKTKIKPIIIAPLKGEVAFVGFAIIPAKLANKWLFVRTNLDSQFNVIESKHYKPEDKHNAFSRYLSSVNQILLGINPPIKFEHIDHLPEEFKSIVFSKDLFNLYDGIMSAEKFTPTKHLGLNSKIAVRENLARFLATDMRKCLCS